jgi:ATP-dependent Clp protease ATP-binding subunit ClpA
MQELRNTLRPEFLNRIDEIVIFNVLDHAEIEKIVEIQLEHLKRRLRDKRVELHFTDAAKSLLAKEGFDLTFGARPLKRTIQRLVQDPLALRLLVGEFTEGDEITVDAQNDQIVFTVTASSPAKPLEHPG